MYLDCKTCSWCGLIFALVWYNTRHEYISLTFGDDPTPLLALGDGCVIRPRATQVTIKYLFTHSHQANPGEKKHNPWLTSNDQGILEASVVFSAGLVGGRVCRHGPPIVHRGFILKGWVHTGTPCSLFSASAERFSGFGRRTISLCVLQASRTVTW